MYYVYFVFVGYRVKIGRTNNLKRRLVVFRHTHHDVFILGVIKCKTQDLSVEVECEMLSRFASDNAFRDMFYLSSEMRDWIVGNTIAYNLPKPNFREYQEKGLQMRLGKRRTVSKEARQMYDNGIDVLQIAIELGKKYKTNGKPYSLWTIYNYLGGVKK